MIAAGCTTEEAAPLGTEDPRLLALHPHPLQDIAATVAVPIKRSLQVKAPKSSQSSLEERLLFCWISVRIEPSGCCLAVFLCSLSLQNRKQTVR